MDGGRVGVANCCALSGSMLNFMNDTEPRSPRCFEKNKRVVETDGANAFLKRHHDAS